jgi:hypothetical protein
MTSESPTAFRKGGILSFKIFPAVVSVIILSALIHFLSPTALSGTAAGRGGGGYGAENASDGADPSAILRRTGLPGNRFEKTRAFLISGTVSRNGAGLRGITMALSSNGVPSGTVKTDANGRYAFPRLINGSYTVTPADASYAFTPKNIQVTARGAGYSVKNFIAQASNPTYMIYGTVTYNGDGLHDVTLRLSGAASAEVTTDKYGGYFFFNLPAGSYTISPRKSPYSFSESTVTIDGTDQNKNLTATYKGCPCDALSESAVAISVSSGAFKNAFTVTLSTSVSGAQIRYTTNGQVPTASSNLYSAAIAVSNTTRLIAAAFVGGTMQGYPSTAVYIKMDSALKSTTHDLPVIIIDTYGTTLTSTTNAPYVDAAYLAFDPADHGGTVALSPTAITAPSAASLAATHIRGNSSALSNWLKKSYRLELRNETAADRDCPMFGLWEDSDWALVGPYPDKTLIHNNFVYELGRDMGMAAPRVKLIELYINTSSSGLANSHYQGVYQLVETIKNSKNRLDLKQLHADAQQDLVSPNITGGYIFSLEWMASEPPEMLCPTDKVASCWNYLDVIDPKDWPDSSVFASAKPAPAYLKHPQYLYLQDYLASFNNAINSATFNDPSTGYPAYIDEQSFIDTIIINELTRSFDGMARSQYFHKQRDKAGETAKIFAGPLWDFDLTAGVGYFDKGIDSTLTGDNFQYNYNLSRISQTAYWFPKLIGLIADRNSDFSKHFRTRWNTLRQTGGLLSNSAMDARIDALIAGLENAAARNFAKWDILNTSPIPSGMFITPKTTTWSAQITLMKTWLHSRAAWLDTQWAQ